MSRYYCPFCSSQIEFHKARNDGILICGQCGDPLMKKPLINLKKIISLVTVTFFFSPLLIMIIFLFTDFAKEKIPSNTQTIVIS